MDLFLTSVVISFVLIFSLFCLTVTAFTFYDLPLRDFLTLWPYKHWLGTFKEMFGFEKIFFTINGKKQRKFNFSSLQNTYYVV